MNETSLLVSSNSHPSRSPSLESGDAPDNGLLLPNRKDTEGSQYEEIYEMRIGATHHAYGALNRSGLRGKCHNG